MSAIDWLKRWKTWWRPTGRPRADPRRAALLGVEPLEHRILLTANTIPPEIVTDHISTPGESDIRQLTLDRPGLLVITCAGADGLDTRLSLSGPGGDLLIQSDGQAPANATDLIRQHLPAGTYAITVQGLGGQTGDYRLETSFTEVTLPFGPIPVGTDPAAVAVGDFDRDGALDIASANISTNTVTILHGVGDGTFLTHQDVYAVGANPVGLVAADLDGDGELDLAVASNTATGSLTILCGLGNGAFTPKQSLNMPAGLTGLVAAQLNEDGFLDLAACNATLSEVVVLRGQANGMFQVVNSFKVGAGPRAITAGDFDGDGAADLVTANNSNPATNSNTSKSLSLLRGNGDGSVQAEQRTVLTEGPVDIIAADLNGDGDLDLATTDLLFHRVSVFLGRGDGTFDDPTTLAAGRRPLKVLAADFNQDGHLDLVTANHFSGDVSILLGHGDGAFDLERTNNVGLVLAGQYPAAFAVADLDDDGRLDVVTGNRSTLPLTDPNALNNPLSVSALLGRGDGTLREARDFAVGDAPNPPALADFNGDGRLDLAVPNVGSADISILLGLADGTFEEQRRFPVAANPQQIVTHDFNRDGRIDLVVNAGSGTTQNMAVLLGIGDGTFQPTQFFDAGTVPSSLLVVDLNGDGLADLASVNRASNNVSVFLGRGDGTFQVLPPFAVAPILPSLLRAVDVNDDGQLDLVTLNLGFRNPQPAARSSVTVMLGRDAPETPAGWTLDVLPAFDVGVGATDFIVRDFDGDGLIDVVTANRGGSRNNPGPIPGLVGQNISFLRGTLDGQSKWTLAPEVRYAVGDGPTRLALDDFNEDGLTDLVVGYSETTSNYVSILLGTPTGSSRPFGPEQRFAVQGPVISPLSIIVQDFNHDGHADLAFSTQNVPQVSVLVGDGLGTFGPLRTYQMNGGPTALLAADLNGDGEIDLVSANKFADDVSVLLGTGDGTFVPSGTTVNPVRATPLLVKLNRDQAPDLVALNNNGQILFRAGRPREPGAFDPPRIVNPDRTFSAREVTVVKRAGDTVLVALDSSDGGLSTYVLQSDGTFRRQAGPQVSGTLPVRLAAADLNGDRLDDLIVACAGSSNVLVYLQTAAGTFPAQANFTFSVGVNPTMIQCDDVDGNGRLDIIVANQSSGDVSVLLNTAAGFTSADNRFRAGTGLYSLRSFNGEAVVRSLEGTSSLAGADFTGDGVLDLIVSNGGSNSLTLVRGNGRGGFLNPTAADTFLTGGEPLLVVVGRFDGDAHIDLAVLTEANHELEIYSGDGAGGFTLLGTVAAGNLPTGLATADIDQDGHLDLLVGNKHGDILVLPGRGDGQFEPYRRAEQSVSLAVTDVNADGLIDFILADAALDRVVVQYSQPGDRPLFRQDGILAPGAVEVADLNRDSLGDLIVSNSGGNNLLVYLGVGQGQFAAALSFFTGTNPAGFTVCDLDSNGWLDLVVANRGSNDVSVLLGQGQLDHFGSPLAWNFEYGPRLNTGFDSQLERQVGLGPVSTAVADVDDDEVPDLLISNSGSNNVSLLRGIGSGFFLDLQPRIFDVGNNPRDILVGNFDGREGIDLVALNAGSNSLTFLSALNGATQRRDLASGGRGPMAGLGGDFNRDGFDDLIVAHNGNGQFALLLGSSDGPEIAQLLTDIRLDHPTDIVLAAQRTGSVEIFASGEGQETIFRLTFNLNRAPLVTDLLPLRGPELALVATFVAGFAWMDGEDFFGRDDPAAADGGLRTLQPFVVGLDNLSAEIGGGSGQEYSRAGDHHWREWFDHVYQGSVQWLTAGVFDFMPSLLAQGSAFLNNTDVLLGPLAHLISEVCGEAISELGDVSQAMWRSWLSGFPAFSRWPEAGPTAAPQLMRGGPEPVRPPVAYPAVPDIQRSEQFPADDVPEDCSGAEQLSRATTMTVDPASEPEAAAAVPRHWPLGHYGRGSRAGEWAVTILMAGWIVPGGFGSVRSDNRLALALCRGLPY